MQQSQNTKKPFATLTLPNDIKQSNRRMVKNKAWALTLLDNNLYMKYGRKDPALFSLEDFQKAKTDPRFYDEQGKSQVLTTISAKMFDAVHCYANSIFAALGETFPIADGDDFDTTGKKNIGGRKTIGCKKKN